jgi:hypothetical protein
MVHLNESSGLSYFIKHRRPAVNLSGVANGALDKRRENDVDQGASPHIGF